MLEFAKTPDHRKLYEAARQLYSQKDVVYDFLYQYFEKKYPDRLRLCLYDLTNFYFEGRKEDSTLARFGRIREKRSDAKPVFLVLLTNGMGFVRRFKTDKGNIGEPTTVDSVIRELESSVNKSIKLFKAKPVVVVDSGIATEENLKHLRGKGLDYICVRRSSLSEYSIVGSDPVTVMDNRNNPIEIQIIKSNKKGDNDLYLYVKSEMKHIKEQSMNEKLTGRFPEDLENIKSSLSKKNGVKQGSMRD
jgi:transposase